MFSMCFRILKILKWNAFSTCKGQHWVLFWHPSCQCNTIIYFREISGSCLYSILLSAIYFVILCDLLLSHASYHILHSSVMCDWISSKIFSQFTLSWKVNITEKISSFIRRYIILLFIYTKESDYTKSWQAQRGVGSC